MEIEIKNIQGEGTGRKAKLSKDIFGIEPNEHVVYLEVKRHLAARRQGTHKTKERNEITGSTKKLRRQKGTGAARVGDIKSPVLRGGGRTFGPKPRDYSFKLNKKEKMLARKSALSQKVKDKQLIVIEDFKLDAPKTNVFAGILSSLKIDQKKQVWVMDSIDKNVYLSARNIPGLAIRPGNSLTTYDILNNQNLIITEGGLKQITEQLSGKKS